DHPVALAEEAAGEQLAVVLIVVADQDHAAVLRLLSAAGLSARRLPRALLNRPTTRAQQRVEACSGRPDAVQVGNQRAGACLRRPPVQCLARRANALEGRAQRAARRREVGWSRLSTRQHLVQQSKELASVGAER